MEWSQNRRQNPFVPDSPTNAPEDRRIWKEKRWHRRQRSRLKYTGLWQRLGDITPLKESLIWNGWRTYSFLKNIGDRTYLPSMDSDRRCNTYGTSP
ncbi:hypothetical protein AAC387_Pa12g0656 [Persea americana]